jgi:hypothetical protein
LAFGPLPNDAGAPENEGCCHHRGHIMTDPTQRALIVIDLQND